MAFEVITVNDAAQQRLSEILSKNPDAEGIRIGVKNAGCAGMEYTVDLVTEPHAGDDKVCTPSITPFSTNDHKVKSFHYRFLL